MWLVSLEMFLKSYVTNLFPSVFPEHLVVLLMNAEGSHLSSLDLQV